MSQSSIQKSVRWAIFQPDLDAEKRVEIVGICFIVKIIYELFQMYLSLLPGRMVSTRRYRSASSHLKLQQAPFMPLSTLQVTLSPRITLSSTFKPQMKLVARHSNPAPLPVNILLWSSPNVHRVSLSSTKWRRSRSTRQSTSPWRNEKKISSVTHLWKQKNGFSGESQRFCDGTLALICSQTLDFICLVWISSEAYQQDVDLTRTYSGSPEKERRWIHTQRNACTHSRKVQGTFLYTWWHQEHDHDRQWGGSWPVMQLHQLEAVHSASAVCSR